jgi:CO/xanthine dehydrogenase Mo-binding subunit
VTAGGGSVDPEGVIRVVVGAGDPLDQAVLRSYVIGAVHMAAGMVCSEGLAVDEAGVVHDLTVRSFGVLSASSMPRVEVVVEPGGGEPVAVSEAVFAATAAAVWQHHGFAPIWPLGASVLGRAPLPN